MNQLIVVTAVIGLVLGAPGAGAHGGRRDYASCDLAAQHRLKGEIGGINKDAGQAHLSFRANILEADLGQARKAGILAPVETDRLFRRVERTRHAVDRVVRRHGALGRAGRARYDRALDAVAARLCRA